MKNRNIYIIATLVQLFIPALAFAQTKLSVTQNGTQPPKVNVQVDDMPLSNTNSVTARPGTGKAQRKVVWIEYGDGQFTTSPESEHFFYKNEKTTFPFMLVKATGIYDQGGKPPKHTAKPVASLLGERFMPGNTVLESADEDVHITPNVFDVLPGDTMMVALTYRKPANAPAGQYQLLFFYNNKNTEVFEYIKPFGFYPVTDNDGKRIPVPFVRMHNGERLVSPGDLPQRVYNPYRDRFKSPGYLAFSIQLNDNREHHIFLTMVPRHDIKFGQNLDVGMDATLFSPDNAPPKAYNHGSHIAKLASHDPNWQEVSPKCIGLPKANQEMTHHVHFQNTGAGPARSVKVKTSLPSGLTGNDIEVTGWSIGGVRNNKNYTLTVNRSSADSIVFEFVYDPANTGKVLFGAAELPDALVNTKTMGDIFFTCKAKPGTPNTMTSGTSIYFDDNEAVKTEETKVEFKKCCDCNKDCKSKSRFMKWLLCKEC